MALDAIMAQNVRFVHACWSDPAYLALVVGSYAGGRLADFEEL